MPKLGLALSGGGFRATLYHLGVVRYLRDSGQLQDVSDIASVSGGTILAAHLVMNWDRYTGSEEEFAAAASEVVRFVQFDVRNHIVRRLPLLYTLSLLGKLARRETAHLTPNAVLERYYREQLYGDTCLYELPENPRLHILATNVSDGVMSVFNRDGLFLQERGPFGEMEFRHVPGQMATLPRVVGASSAFPGFFPPVDITAADLGVRDGQFPKESFTDGGVYDNLGIRAFSWLREEIGEFDNILVSDAGKPFQVLSDETLGFIGQSIRASDILWDRVWQLERENFGQQKGFSFLPITEIVSPEEDPNAQHPVVQMEVQSIRTDLDSFTDFEINALVRHGYEVTRKICNQIGLVGEGQTVGGRPWGPCIDNWDSSESEEETELPKGVASSRASAATQLSRQLRQSGHRKVWSTLLDWRDWPSYVYLGVLLLLFVCVPAYVVQLHRHTEMLTSVINSISQGDPDIKQILDLVEGRTTVDWPVVEVGEVSEPVEIDLTGVDVLSQSRIFDLRNFDPSASDDKSRGFVMFYDRVVLRFNEDYHGDKKVAFNSVFPLRAVEVRQPANQPQGAFNRIGPSDSESIQTGDGMKIRHQTLFDLSDIPIGQRVTLQAVSRVELPASMSGHFPFYVNKKTELLTSWLLFPDNHPYSSYQLVRYPADQSAAPTTMDPRFAIDHPYGNLIGWSVITPKEGTVYECRWTTRH
jgi:predicted acylesterase/phospholipase RssA